MKIGDKGSSRGMFAENRKPQSPVIINTNSEKAKKLEKSIKEKAKLFYDNSVALARLNGK